MLAMAATPNPERDNQQLPVSAQEAEHRIRWERQPENGQRLVIQDAVTGKVLAVVGSLFDICRY
jgi:hypothetical protein